MSYRDVPHVYPARNQQLASLFNFAASGGLVKMLVIGDSQESASGRRFYEALTMAFAKRFGNGVPGIWGFTHSVQEFPLQFTSINSTSNSAAAASNFLPGLPTPQLLPTNATNTGFAMGLIWDAKSGGSYMHAGGEWWHVNGVYDRANTRCTIYGVDSTIDPTSTETDINWAWRIRTDSTPAFAYSGAVNTGTNAVIPIANAPGWWSYTLPAPASWSDLYPVMSVRSGDATTRLTVACAHMYRENCGGVSVLMSGVGGVGSSDLTTNFKQCGGMLRAIAPEIVMLGYGANDAFSLALTAAQHKANQQANIDFIRQHLPRAVIVLTSDLYRADADNDATYLARRTLFEGYADVLKELCDANPDVVLINEHRICVERGFNESTENFEKPTEEWVIDTTYAAGYLVKRAVEQNWAKGETDYYFRSNRGGNTGNQPGVTPGSNNKQVWWEPLARGFADYVHETPLLGYLRGEWVVDSLLRIGSRYDYPRTRWA